MSVSKLAPKGNLITTLTNTQSLAIRRPATYLSSQHRQFSNTLTPLSEPSSKQPIDDSSTSASANFPSQTTSNHFTSRRQAQEDPDHIDRQTTELTKSSTDNAAAETDVAFDSSTRPEHARDTTGQVLEVSAANPEVSKRAAEQPPGGPHGEEGRGFEDSPRTGIEAQAAHKGGSE